VTDLSLSACRRLRLRSVPQGLESFEQEFEQLRGRRKVAEYDRFRFVDIKWWFKALYGTSDWLANISISEAATTQSPSNTCIDSMVGLRSYTRILPQMKANIFLMGDQPLDFARQPRPVLVVVATQE
jgi:hypothetical protein